MKITTHPNTSLHLKFATWVRRHWLATAGLCLVAAASLVAVGQVSPPNIPATNLSSDPLFAATGGDKPAMALALSVEFPTVGAQYVEVPNTSTDASYANTNEYLGYYDAESCYTYNKAPTETPVSPQTTDDFKRFDRSGPAIALSVPDATQPTKTSRMCTNAFSGNFLNWSSSSAIDMLRLALTGGDRYIDSASLTILQRAVLSDGNPIHFWNSTNFPGKQLLKSGGSSGTAYFGAIPTSMATVAGTSDIWVANTLNKIYFGTAKVGSNSGSASSYSLGGPSAASSTGPVVNPYATKDTARSLFNNSGGSCADENNPCTFTGIQEVLYGDNSIGWITFPASGGVACNNTMTGTFVDPAPGIVKKCYIRAYTGSWTPPTSTAALSSDPFFYSRVQVCNVNSSGVLQDERDYGFCKKYPGGNFKPSGAIQKYSDQLRLAAFGYLMDQTASYNSGGRYGGVLRAPIKYVGGKTFDVNGLDNTPSTGNPNKEWNESTGVFIVNPESDSTYGKSGVITYLNQFGRTGPTPGLYKKYDPVGELHYEALRYLQGLPPSANAISSITAAMYDGFPVSTTWTDPYGGGRSPAADYACLKSNIVVIGDINTHDGNRLPGASAANNIPDINAWRTVVQNFEKNSSTTYVDGQGVSRTTGNPNGANNSVPSATDRSQIMGSAYWAHTHDIRGTGWTAEPTKQRPGLRVKTFTFDVNEYAQQNVATTRRTANQFFMASKYGGFESEKSSTNLLAYNTQGNPFTRDDGTADKFVWEDTNTSATRTGEANTYFLQSKARDVLSAFDDIFSRASTSARSIAGSAIASKNLALGGSLIYQSSFDTSDWSGDVLAFPIVASGASDATLSQTPAWTATARLAALPAPASSRNIVAGRGGATTNPVASAFTWGAIDTAFQDKLSRASPSSAADSLGEARLNYLRGDKSKEGNPFRARSKLLGDVVNSGVVYSGAPVAPEGAGQTFGGFKTTNASRTPAVFVGANDGMLHAFNASTGDELFAYIPSVMATKLAALTSTSYNNNHQPYVDSSPTVAEAQVGSSGTSADWKTVLVSGMGGGGSGVFALDTTNPSAFSASNVMWEFTRQDDADMGYVVGRPQILKIRTSAPGAAVTYRWFAAVPSGVNNYVPDSNSTFSLTGQPALFLLALDKSTGVAWNASGANPNYYKISLPVDSTLSVTNATGLINFKPTFGLAGNMETAYMGDMHGKLWKLDFTKRGSTEWTIDKLSAFNKGTAAAPNPYPLYAAKTAAGAIQPISMAPLLAAGPVVGGTNTVMVGFGTGKYLEASDKTSTTQNSFYTVYDNGSTAADNSPVGASVISGRGRLQQGTVNTTTFKVSVPAFRFGRAVSDLDATQRSGWYFDLPVSGERIVSNGSILGNNFILSSLIPASSGAGGSCTAAGGSGNAYQLNIDTGNGIYRQSTVGLLGDVLVVDVSTENSLSTSTGQGTRTTRRRTISIGSQGIAISATGAGLGPGEEPEITANRRLSWRQINNYQDLKNAP